MATHYGWNTLMYQRILVIQRQTDSSLSVHWQFHCGAEACLCKGIIYYKISYTGQQWTLKWKISLAIVLDAIITCKTVRHHWLANQIPDKTWNLIAMNIMTVFIRNYLIRVDFWSDFCKLGTLPNNPAASSMIWCCKRYFSRHGMPDVVADTALQFDSKDFE